MRTLVVFSGAGLSQESGIPTFRDSNGLWHNHRVEDVASPEAWRRDKSLVLEFYAQRLRGVQSAQPNAAHLSLARLEEKFRVVHVTQNIDDLLERAGCSEIWHLHGSIVHRKCEWHRSIASGNPGFSCTFRAGHTEPVSLGEMCPLCGGQLRPDVVWFGEAVDMRYAELDSLRQAAEVFICVGTSARVYPAADLLRFFGGCARKYYVDPQPVPVPGYTLLAGPAGEQLRRLADELLA
jgi:NAD-dependent deacetylase